MIANITVIRSLRLGIGIDLALQLMNHRRTMTIECQYIRQTRTQFVEDRYLATTAFIHHRHTHSITESRFAVYEDGIDVLDAGVGADTIVGDIVMDIVQVRIVAHLAVMQGSIVDTRVNLQPAR